MRFALLLFILVPIIELAVLIEVGSQIGSVTTIALVFLTAIVGVSLIRKQGFETAVKAQEKLNRGELPASEVAEGMMLAFAGLCLLMPGFITDILGGILLIPPFRKAMAAGIVVSFIVKHMPTGARWTYRESSNSEQQGDIIEGEFIKDDNDLIDKK